jgi:hypothetical protein
VKIEDAMMNEKDKTINIYPAIIISLLLHGIISLITVNYSNKEYQSKRLSLKLKKIRTLGVKESKNTKHEFRPSKKSEDSDNLFKKFAIAEQKPMPKLIDKVKTQPSGIKKTTPKQQAKAKVNYLQQKLMQEAKSQKSVENPLFNDLDYNVKFIPPKGVTQDELNEFEKVFYSFYKRIAIKYINTVNATLIEQLSDKPYFENTLRQHRPAVLTAMIKYDAQGNAEMIKILKSSHNDDVHNIFEKVLRKMDKIPNVTTKLRDKDGKYTAFFQIGLNNI